MTETDRLHEVIGAILDVSPETLSDDSGRASLDEWDSLAHLNVIGGVEEVFDVLFSSAEMRELTTVGSLRSALTGRGIAL